MILRKLHWLLLLAMLGSVSAQPSPQPAQICRTFVQNFYQWYVPKALNGSGYQTVLKLKKSSFTPELFEGLKQDYEAQARNSDDIVGLDFDPFLNTQEPASRYVVGRLIPKGDRYWIEVYSVSSGKKNATPDVMPEVMYDNGRCMFANFHYGQSKWSDDENVLSMLKKLREEREKPAK